MKGAFEFQVEGKTRGFLFNFLTLAVLEERREIPLDEFIERFSEGNKGPKMRMILWFFEAAAINYAEEKEEKVDFTLNDVSEWVGLVGFDKCSKLMSKALKATTPKNSSPLPQTTEG